MNMMAKSLTKKIKEIENKSILVKKWRSSIINHFWWSLFVTIVRHCASVFIISHSPSNIFSSTVSSIQYVLYYNFGAQIGKALFQTWLKITDSQHSTVLSVDCLLSPTMCSVFVIRVLQILYTVDLHCYAAALLTHAALLWSGASDVSGKENNSFEWL